MTCSFCSSTEDTHTYCRACARRQTTGISSDLQSIFDGFCRYSILALGMLEVLRELEKVNEDIINFDQFDTSPVVAALNKLNP